jgi:hypothetical protein
MQVQTWERNDSANRDPVKQLDVAGDDFHAAALAAAALRLVIAVRQLSFDVDLAAFASEPPMRSA